VGKVLVIYHSNTGNTEAMAKAVAEGASYVPGTTVVTKKALEATAQDVLGADAVAFGCPTNFAYMAGAMKHFFDTSFFSLREKVTDKPYVAFVNTGRNIPDALNALERICGENLKLKKAAEQNALVHGKPTPEALTKCRDLGTALAQKAA